MGVSACELARLQAIWKVGTATLEGRIDFEHNATDGFIRVDPWMHHECRVEIILWPGEQAYLRLSKARRR